MNHVPADYTIKGVKSFLKQLSAVIRVLKQLRKLPKNQRLSGFTSELVEEAKKEQAPLTYMRFLARIYHIAYSEARGRTYSEIESKCTNKLDVISLGKIKSRMAEAVNIAPQPPKVEGDS